MRIDESTFPMLQQQYSQLKPRWPVPIWSPPEWPVAMRWNVPERIYRKCPAVSYSGMKQKLYGSFRRSETTTRSIEFGTKVEALLCFGEEPYFTGGHNSDGYATSLYRAAKLAEENVERNERIWRIVRGPDCDYQVPLFSLGLHYLSGNEGFLPCKALLDILKLQRRIIADIKTTRCSGPEEFAHEACRLHYPMQVSHYIELAEELYGGEFRFLWVVVCNHESKRPGEVFVMNATPFKEIGRKGCLAAVEQLMVEAGRREFPELDFDVDEIQTYEPPKWAEYQAEAL